MPYQANSSAIRPHVRQKIPSSSQSTGLPQVPGVERQVVGHEGGDEVIAVVIAGVAPQGERLAGFGARRFERFRPELLLLEEFVGATLIDQDACREW
jgi:hypothetical protein